MVNTTDTRDALEVLDKAGNVVAQVTVFVDEVIRVYVEIVETIIIYSSNYEQLYHMNRV